MKFPAAIYNLNFITFHQKSIKWKCMRLSSGVSELIQLNSIVSKHVAISWPNSSWYPDHSWYNILTIAFAISWSYLTLYPEQSWHNILTIAITISWPLGFEHWPYCIPRIPWFWVFSLNKWSMVVRHFPWNHWFSVNQGVALNWPLTCYMVC